MISRNERYGHQNLTSISLTCKSVHHQALDPPPGPCARRHANTGNYLMSRQAQFATLTWSACPRHDPQLGENASSSATTILLR